LVARQSAEEGTEQDWSEFLGVLAAQRREFGPDELRILVYTDGGSPNPAQRKRLAQTLEGYHPRVAIVSDSVKVRFSGALIALFQRNFRQYSVDEMKLAYGHLKLSPTQCESAEKIMRVLEAQLSAQPEI